mmetsp:Transcript_23079/g.49402  ORF Transcript_23079/g.49402 Transcript_23079/m.49402 type:complete len:108 (-) Transcript_23079:67-390(-)
MRGLLTIFPAVQTKASSATVRNNINSFWKITACTERPKAHDDRQVEIQHLQHFDYLGQPNGKIQFQTAHQTGQLHETNKMVAREREAVMYLFCGFPTTLMTFVTRTK